MPSDRYRFVADMAMLVDGDCHIEQERADYRSTNTSGSQKSTNALNDNWTYIVSVRDPKWPQTNLLKWIDLSPVWRGRSYVNIDDLDDGVDAKNLVVRMCTFGHPTDP